MEGRREREENYKVAKGKHLVLSQGKVTQMRNRTVLISLGVGAEGGVNYGKSQNASGYEYIIRGVKDLVASWSKGRCQIQPDLERTGETGNKEKRRG